jgi:hypothetical protein
MVIVQVSSLGAAKNIKGKKTTGMIPNFVCFVLFVVSGF